MEPGAAWEARLQLSGRAEPSRELVGASEGPKGPAPLPATLSSHPDSHHHTIQRQAPGPAHLGRPQTTLPWLSPAVCVCVCVSPPTHPCSSFSVPCLSQCGLLSPPWEEELCQNSRPGNA